MSGGDVRVGLAQWTPGLDAAVNLEIAVAAINELARRGCGLVVLPELWLCGYRSATLREDARAAAEPLDGPVQQRLAGLAREAGLVLCAGSFPERDGGRLYNTAVVYGPAGDRLLVHRKACLYGGAEGEAFTAGAAAVTAGDVAGLGRTGLCICFDGDFPETARALRAAGAGVVLHPSAYEAGAPARRVRAGTRTARGRHRRRPRTGHRRRGQWRAVVSTAPEDGGNAMSQGPSTEPGTLERHTIDIIPLSERHGKPRDLFTIWFSPIS
jgi:predicted amidohydrolase